MRLLSHDDRGGLNITGDLADHDIRPYAILSHTWGKDEDEVTFRDIGSTLSQAKPGYKKIEFCGSQARQDGWQRFWVDTCCIDKANHTELSKAITSMYRWYQQAQVCYVYLADVTSQRSTHTTLIGSEWESKLRQSRWFTRGWTLQELLAPRQVIFYSNEWERLGTRDELKELLCDITNIPAAALVGRSLSTFPVIERMRWTHGRQTREKEDQAYCLLGIFGVYMYLNYGEGDNAFRRLQREIDLQSSTEKLTEQLNSPLSVHLEVASLGLCLSTAPYIQANMFIGRAAEIRRMHNILWPEQATIEQRRVVLGGIGGVGKTQLAIAYARQHAHSYTSVLWLNASSEQTLHASFHLVAQQIPTLNELGNQNQEQVTMQVLSWLTRCHDTPWLLIFDNYDEPDRYDIGRFHPHTSRGSIIITTRLPDDVDGEILRIQTLTEIDDSLKILEVRSGREGLWKDAGARAVATRLAGLPIALVTAGAFLRNSHITFQEYLDAYEEHWRVGRRPVTVREYQDRTLYNTWDLTYSNLKRNDEEAAQVLRLLAYFDHKEIWYELLQAGLPDHLPTWLPASLADQINFADVMGVLVRYGLTDIHNVTNSHKIYSMHGCVHDWISASSTGEIKEELYWYAFDCVATLANKCSPRTLSELRYARLSHHALHLVHRRFKPHERLSSCSTQHIDKVNSVGELLRRQMQAPTAETMYSWALASYWKPLEPELPQVLTMIFNLGNIYAHQGKLDESEQPLKRVLAGRERIYGRDHVATLQVVNSLANLHRRQGNLAESEQLLRRAVTGLEKIYGPGHKTTLQIVHNLGVLFQRQGRLTEAEQLLTRALTGREKTRGPTHAQTLETVIELGVLCNAQDKQAEAEQLLTRALAEYEKLYGPNHPYALGVLTNLAMVYTSQKRLVEAEQLRRQAQEGFEKALGPDHPTTQRAIRYHNQLREYQAQLKLYRSRKRS